jgi:hypothetical protein
MRSRDPRDGGEGPIDFAYSQSLAYREAMELCRGIPSFTSTGEGNDVVQSIDVPITDIAVLMRLSELVGGWKSFRITIDGGEARRDDLIRLGGACYGKRQASEDPEQYCFGANRLEYNLWGCRRLDMPIDEAGHGWMAYGSLDAQGVWHFDKPRISRALESAMVGCRLCPVFDRARVQKTLDGLPETVDPRRDEHWRYRGGARTQEGAGLETPASPRWRLASRSTWSTAFGPNGTLPATGATPRPRSTSAR